MIKRVGVIAAARSLPLQRDIDDPARICAYVHVRKGIFLFLYHSGTLL